MFYLNYSYSLFPWKSLLMLYNKCYYLRGWPNICVFKTCVWLLLDCKFLAIKCIQVLDLLWGRDRHQVWFLICLIWLLLLLLLCHGLQRSTVHAIDWKLNNSVFPTAYAPSMKGIYRDSRFSQLCFKRRKSSGMWCCTTSASQHYEEQQCLLEPYTERTTFLPHMGTINVAIRWKAEFQHKEGLQEKIRGTLITNCNFRYVRERSHYQQ